jgi:hypothetical protein
MRGLPGNASFLDACTYIFSQLVTALVLYKYKYRSFSIFEMVISSLMGNLLL